MGVGLVEEWVPTSLEESTLLAGEWVPIAAGEAEVMRPAEAED